MSKIHAVLHTTINAATLNICRFYHDDAEQGRRNVGQGRLGLHLGAKIRQGLSCLSP